MVSHQARPRRTCSRAAAQPVGARIKEPRERESDIGDLHSTSTLVNA